MEKHDRFEDDVLNYQVKFQTAKKKSLSKKLKFFFDPYLSVKKKDKVKVLQPPLTNVEKWMDFTDKNFAKEVSSIVLRRPECLYEWLGKERLTR